MHSPEAFLAGIGKGTEGLMRGVVSGAITSTAAIIGSASKGVAKGVGAVSGDREFVRQREEKRRANTASSGGVLSGIKAGGESVFSGFASGITGLVTRPFQEGKKGGALGFVMGIGLGVAGVVTKPILGVTDGIASLVHGISNQVSDAIVIQPARPPRAFDRSASDVTDKVLVPLDLASANAQEHVLKSARRGGYSDRFMSHTAVDGSRHGAFSSSSSSSPSSSSSSSLPSFPSPSLPSSSSLSGYDPSCSMRSTSTSPSSAPLTQSARSGKIASEDAFLSERPLSRPLHVKSERSNCLMDASSVVVSEMFVSVLRKDGFPLGRYSFGEVSHCAFFCDSSSSSTASAGVSGSVCGVDLVLYQSNSNNSNAEGTFDLSFGSPHIALFGDEKVEEKVEGDSGYGERTRTSSSSSSSSSGRIRPNMSLDHGHQVMKEGEEEGQSVVRVQCKSRVIAAKLYSALFMCASQMGNPSSVLPPDVATAISSDTSSMNVLSSKSHSSTIGVEGSSEVRTAFGGYRFGTANRTKHPANPCLEKDLLLRAGRRLAEPIPIPTVLSDDRGQQWARAFAKSLDERVWQLVCDWTGTHQQLQSSRCLAALIINQSESPVQILRTDAMEGRNVMIFGVTSTCTSSPQQRGSDSPKGYDEESRTLLGGGGAAVVFAFGFLPSLIDSAHVTISIATSAFNATVSTRPNRTLCVAVGGYTAGYLEKSLVLSEYWAKYVMLVN